MSGLRASTDADSHNDEFNWEVANRSSCGICLEAFDSSSVIPRVLSCGHTLCETCIAKSLVRGALKCICQNTATVRDVKLLPINQALIDISDFVKTQSSKQSTKQCAECLKSVDLCWLALCNEAQCNKKLVCLSCVSKKHRTHDYVEYEQVILRVRADCRSSLQQLQHIVSEKLQKASRLSVSVMRRLLHLEQAYFVNNEKWGLMMQQTENVVDEKESAELVEIAASLLDPMNNEVQHIITELESLSTGLDRAFGQQEVQQRTETRDREQPPEAPLPPLRLTDWNGENVMEEEDGFIGYENLISLINA